MFEPTSTQKIQQFLNFATFPSQNGALNPLLVFAFLIEEYGCVWYLVSMKRIFAQNDSEFFWKWKF